MNLRHLIFLIGLLALLTMSECHKCMHDTIHKDTQFHVVDAKLPEHSRRMLSDSYRNIRIMPDYSGLSEFLPTDHYNYITMELIRTAITYIQKILKVSEYPGKVSIRSLYSCVDAKIPSKYADTDIDADLFLLVSGRYNSDHAAADATSCALDSYTNRPIIGSIRIKETHFSPYTINFEDQVRTILHELTHVLGFDSSLFSKFIDPVTKQTLLKSSVVQVAKVRDVYTRVIILPKVVEYARQYFGCANLTGLELENEGSSGTAGSHWERRVLGDEYMTGSIIPISKISNFTLVFLESTGWYQVNYSYAEPTTWGKNKKCDFITGDCIDRDTKMPRFDEFCSDKSDTYGSCSKDLKFKTSCGLESGEPEVSAWDYFDGEQKSYDELSDNCPHSLYTQRTSCSEDSSYSFSDIDEVFGENSVCFEGTLRPERYYERRATQPFCLNYKCNFENDTWTLSVNVSYIGVHCFRGGERKKIPNYSGYLVCPEPQEFCPEHAANSCPLGCFQNGVCKSHSTCTCNDGWSVQSFCGAPINSTSCKQCNGGPCFGDTCLFSPENPTNNTPFKNTTNSTVLKNLTNKSPAENTKLRPEDTTTSLPSENAQNSSSTVIVLTSLVLFLTIIIIALVVKIFQLQNGQMFVSQHNLPQKIQKKDGELYLNIKNGISNSEEPVNPVYQSRNQISSEAEENQMIEIMAQPTQQAVPQKPNIEAIKSEDENEKETNSANIEIGESQEQVSEVY